MRATLHPLTFILSPSGGGEENALGVVGEPVGCSWGSGPASNEPSPVSLMERVVMGSRLDKVGVAR